MIRSPYTDLMRFSEYIVVTPRAASACLQVALDQTIWGPFSCTMFYLVMSTMEGHTPAESLDKLRTSFLSTYLSGGAVFLPTALLTYSVIPRQHRGLFLQSVGLGTSSS